MEAWRTAVNRWGDTLFELALLLTNQRAAAEAATVAAVCRVFSAPTNPHAEHDLYAALLNQQKRWRQPLRDRVLPRVLAKIEPLDRALLGLWLLRHIDGERLAAIVGQPIALVTERLSLLLARATNIPLVDLQPDGEHVTLGRWLEAQLGLQPQPPHIRNCVRCRAAQASWQRAAEELQATLQETLKKEHLPPSCEEAIEEALFQQQYAGDRRWWQERRVWIPAFFTAIALALALVIGPWGGEILPTATPRTTAEELVQATLDGWTTLPVTDTLHRQVWALDPRIQSSEPLITDIWLNPATSGQYRVEVRRNNQLIEWQLADGKQTLYHAGEANYSSCPWRTDASATFRMLDQAALKFKSPPEQQRAVRDARLLQGAYGAGYRALQQALTADDLRSFGTRRDNQRTLAVLSFTDRLAQPPRQILLRIDPQTHQLYGVQEVALSGGQSTARDLWRLQVQDQPRLGVPTNIPRWPQNVTRDQIFDVACPALNPQHVVSLSTLVGDSQQWYLPRTLPPGIDRAALLTLNPVVTYIDYTPLGVPRGSVATFLGRDRWLTISDLDWHPGAEGSVEIARGGWSVEIGNQPRPGIWSLKLRTQQNRGNPSSPTIAIYGSGWTQEELLKVVDSLDFFDPQVWLSLDSAFLDARPLPQPVHDSIQRAFAALQPAPDTTLYSETKTEVRTDPKPQALNDPYTISDALRAPPVVVRKQWQTYQGAELTRFRDVYELDDGTINALIASDGSQFKMFIGAEGRLYTGESTILPLQQQQPGIEMVRSLLRTNDPILFTEQDDAWVLQQSSPYRFVTMSFEFSGSVFQQPPWTPGLGDGEIVRRLWLDRRTYAPRQFTVVHRDLDGTETPLLTTTLVTRRTADALSAEQLLALPALSDDVLTMNITAIRETTVDLASTRPVTQILAWPTSSATILEESPRRRGSRTALSSSGLWQQRWDQFAPSDVWYISVYTFPPDDTSVTITQGPSSLLRHILRYQSTAQSWTSSQPIEVTIAGQPRTAWLLSNDTSAALVIEIDDLLVHIAAPIGYLQGPILERLPQLSWAPIN
ncbi:MAG TPA: hypothetical protein VGD58_02460 [Herpetosiphonaceae bacterium]